MTTNHINPHFPFSLFSLGHIVATPGALHALQRSNQTPQSFLSRHVRGEWGDLDDHDRQENALGLVEGFRLLSSYTTALGEKLWIVTEADRSSTTLLLPDEY